MNPFAPAVISPIKRNTKSMFKAPVYNVEPETKKDSLKILINFIQNSQRSMMLLGK